MSERKTLRRSQEQQRRFFGSRWSPLACDLQRKVFQELLWWNELGLRFLRLACFFQLVAEFFAFSNARMTHRGPEQTSTETTQS